MIPQYAPKIQARVYTRGGRIDLGSTYLLSASVQREINSPAGQWDLLLTGGRVDGRSTFMDLIAPMDYVEIEIARVPSLGGASVSMRGFVDNVRGHVGDNQRRISVNGRDFGKLLSQFQVYYLNELDPAASLNPQARLEINFGIPVGVVSPSQFVNLVFGNIVQPNLAALQRIQPGVPGYRPRVSVADRWAVNGFAVQPFSGAVYNLLTTYADRPWVETFTTDARGGPEFVYRFAPYEDYNGRPVGSGSTGVHRLDTADVISHDLGTSDTEVITYYFVYPEYFLLDRLAFKGEAIALGRGNPFLDQALMQRYGYRPMEKSSRLIPSQAGAEPANAAAAIGGVTDMAVELTQWLVNANRDNWRFRNGSINVMGGGGIQPGDYVEIPGMNLRAYIAGMSTSYNAEAGSCTASLNVIRGRPLAAVV